MYHSLFLSVFDYLADSINKRRQQVNGVKRRKRIPIRNSEHTNNNIPTKNNTNNNPSKPSKFSLCTEILMLYFLLMNNTWPLLFSEKIFYCFYFRREWAFLYSFFQFFKYLYGCTYLWLLVYKRMVKRKREKGKSVRMSVCHVCITALSVET